MPFRGSLGELRYQACHVRADYTMGHSPPHLLLKHENGRAQSAIAHFKREKSRLSCLRRSTAQWRARSPIYEAIGGLTGGMVFGWGANIGGSAVGGGLRFTGEHGDAVGTKSCWQRRRGVGVAKGMTLVAGPRSVAAHHRRPAPANLLTWSKTGHHCEARLKDQEYAFTGPARGPRRPKSLECLAGSSTPRCQAGRWSGSGGPGTCKSRTPDP